MNAPSTTAPRIFVLEPDDNTRPILKQNLQTWGYQVVLALDVEDAIQRLQVGGDRVGLILISQVGQTIHAWIAIGQQIRQSTELATHAPIVIMAEHYGADLEGQDIQVGDNEYVTYLEDGQQLKNILRQLCPTDAG